jgi:hypothetical protein
VSIISDNIGTVEPGGTFAVPAARVGSYTSRSDMALTYPPTTQTPESGDATESAA